MRLNILCLGLGFLLGFATMLKEALTRQAIMAEDADLVAKTMYVRGCTEMKGSFADCKKGQGLKDFEEINKNLINFFYL